MNFTGLYKVLTKGFRFLNGNLTQISHKIEMENENEYD